MTTYFSFLFICMIPNKKILISEVNFQCDSKNQKTPPFKRQMCWQTFYLPSESIEQRMLFCNIPSMFVGRPRL